MKLFLLLPLFVSLSAGACAQEEQEFVPDPNRADEGASCDLPIQCGSGMLCSDDKTCVVDPDSHCEYYDEQILFPEVTAGYQGAIPFESTEANATLLLTESGVSEATPFSFSPPASGRFTIELSNQELDFRLWMRAVGDESYKWSGVWAAGSLFDGGRADVFHSANLDLAELAIGMVGRDSCTSSSTGERRLFPNSRGPNDFGLAEFDGLNTFAEKPIELLIQVIPTYEAALGAHDYTLSVIASE